MNLMRSVVLAVGLLGVAVSAFGHHSEGAYDRTPVTLSGTVTKYLYANPHTLIYFDTLGENGVMQNWVIVTAAPAVLSRRGWKRDMLAPGDTITVTAFVSKEKKHEMRLQPGLSTHQLVVNSGKSKGMTVKVRGEVTCPQNPLHG